MDQSWNSLFKEAIEKAERAVRGARNVSAASTRNFYQSTFNYKGATYRLDIAVEAGDGHFN